MDLLKLLPFILLGIGFFWALWLVFKRDLLGQNLWKLISYFIGVWLTFIIIGWLVDTFIPQWTAQRLVNTRNSQDVQTIEQVGHEIWSEAMSSQPVLERPTLVTNPTQPAPTAEVTVEPAPTGSPIVPTESTTLSGQSVQGQVYVVQQGDTLYSIARTHGVSVDAIKQANGLTSDEIYIGQQLIIPAP